MRFDAIDFLKPDNSICLNSVKNVNKIKFESISLGLYIKSFVVLFSTFVESNAMVFTCA